MQEVIQNLIEQFVLETEKKIDKNPMQQAELIIQIGELIENKTSEEQYEVADAIYSLIQKEENYMMVIFMYSAVLQWKPEVSLMEELMDYVSGLKDIPWNTRYFLYYQISNRIFRYRQLETEQTKIKKWKMLQDIVSDVYINLELKLCRIEKEKRNQNLVIVLADQILNPTHAPTKTAFGRCKALIDNMGKEVILINTAESLPFEGAVPFYDGKKAMYFEEMCTVQELEWKGIKIPYAQFKQNMPNREGILCALSVIEELKPSYIISVGGSSLVANLANYIVPVITLSLCFSDFETTLTDYQITGKQITDNDKTFLQEVAYGENQIITSQFTFGLLEQTEHYTKEELGIPEDRFVIGIVGARLDDEMTEELLQRLNEIMVQNYFVVFMGRYESYEGKMEKYTKLKRNSVFLGFCVDILSRLEHCDIYLNPYRKGGGSSCVEAMFLGKPVITIDYGDVATNAGELFLVGDYDTMFEVLERYRTDRVHYEEMSQIAEKRASELMDDTGAFEKAIAEFERREKEKYE